MNAPASFRDVISLWPSKIALTRDLSTIGGAEKIAPVREWWHRDRIPVIWFDPLLKAAAHRGFEEVTYRLLTDLFKA